MVAIGEGFSHVCPLSCHHCFSFLFRCREKEKRVPRGRGNVGSGEGYSMGEQEGQRLAYPWTRWGQHSAFGILLQAPGGLGRALTTTVLTLWHRSLLKSLNRQRACINVTAWLLPTMTSKYLSNKCRLLLLLLANIPLNKIVPWHKLFQSFMQVSKCGGGADELGSDRSSLWYKVKASLYADHKQDFLKIWITD